MGLIFMDGFESYQNNTINMNSVLTTRGWVTSSVGGGGFDRALFQSTDAAYAGEAGAVAPQSVRMADESDTSMKYPVNIADGGTVVMGVYFKVNSSISSNRPFITIQTGGNDCIQVLANATGGGFAVNFIGAGPDGPTVGTFTTGNWFYVELKVTNGVTTGSYELRIDGTLVDSNSNIDTTRTGVVENYSFVELNGSGSFNDTWNVDDFYVGEEMDFIGPLQINTYLPTAEGTSSDYTPSAGSDNSAMVADDRFHDGDDTYVESNASGDRDVYAFGDKAGTGAIKAIQQTSYGKDTGDGLAAASHVVKNGASETVGTSQVFTSTSTYTAITDLYETDPNTGGAWSDSAFNDSEFGYETT